jgi:hypothetical protein
MKVYCRIEGTERLGSREHTKWKRKVERMNRLGKINRIPLMDRILLVAGLLTIMPKTKYNIVLFVLLIIPI